MLYVPLLARIQSQAAITSLVRAVPVSSITSSETIFAFGAAPVTPEAEPAAIPATKVPCPRPSPGEFGVMLARLTCAATRAPPSKSERLASMPESMTAMVGACGAGFDDEPHRYAFPEAYGQSWVVDSVPLSFTVESGVIVSPGFLASEASLPAVMSTATAPADCRRRRMSAPRPLTLSAAPEVPAVLWMMTWSFWSGFFAPFSSRPGLTYVPSPLPPPLSAPADNGTTSVRAARAANAKRRPSRPPDPQRAFLRDSPRDPLPHRALERTPRFQPVDSRIVSVFLPPRSRAGRSCRKSPNAASAVGT